MLRPLVFALVACGLAACGGGKTGIYKHDYAGSITLTLVNSSPRPVEAVLIHPVTNPNRGTSWTPPIAPGAITTVKIAEGHYELIAVSAERRIDARTRETPEAMTMLELHPDRGDLKIVFHDAGQTVGGLGQAGTLGVTFVTTQAPESGEPSSDTTEPDDATP